MPKTDWVKVWTNHYSLFTAGLFAIEYTSSIKKEVGKGFSKVYLESKNDLVTIYRSDKELSDFTFFLAKRSVKEDDFYNQTIDKLKTLEQQIKNYIKLEPKAFLNPESLSGFIQAHKALLAYFLTPLWSVNAISKTTGPKSKKLKISKLYTKARMDTEFLYKDIESYLDKVFKYISNREKISYLQARSLLPKELLIYSKTGKLPAKKELTNRVNYCVIVGEDRVINVLINKKAKNAIHKISYSETSSTKLLQGQIVFKAGVVTGKVKKAERLADVKFAKPNLILVTPMTQPDWVPYLNKFKAFVTDVGGMLCHAAIVARELRKPCVVGTKFASQVFKEGDMVEVDANKGIVRLVSRKALNESRRVKKL